MHVWIRFKYAFLRLKSPHIIKKNVEAFLVPSVLLHIGPGESTTKHTVQTYMSKETSNYTQIASTILKTRTKPATELTTKI